MAVPNIEQSVSEEPGSSVETMTFTVTEPTNGRLMVVWIAFGNEVSNVVPPSGWTEFQDDIATRMSGYLAWKAVGASEGTTFQFDWTNAGFPVGGWLEISGADNTTPLHQNVVDIASERVSSHISPAVTTTLADCLGLRTFASDTDTTISDVTSTVVFNIRGADDTTCVITEEDWASTGDQGTETWTSSTTRRHVMRTVAIAPAPAASGSLLLPRSQPLRHHLMR